ncbi:MAG TPA: hypothetical protein VNO43_15995 [Candidatus Eisenbacteria bacterium]|nr:hypothetical protein [Candidatus Eisenbacteria bacterium]
MKRMLTIPAMGFALIAFAACSSQRPVLSSNEHLMRVGPNTAERDVEECMQRAQAVTHEQADKQNVAANTVAGAAVGAAAGGAGGAVVGRAGQGAAAGAAGGAAASLTAGLLRALFTSKPPDPFYRGLVDRCLRDKGYEPAGWK